MSEQSLTESALCRSLSKMSWQEVCQSYSDENTFDENKEAEYLNEKKESSNEIEIIAIINEKIIGTAGIEAVGSQYKLKHRADFGISILKEYWGIGLGKALTKACIQCAKEAGYEQLELNVVSENTRAISLYCLLIMVVLKQAHTIPATISAIA